MTSKVDLRRGPKVGDAASLWNFTPSPGWTKEEVFILKLCLQKYGIGRWVQILDTGLLPGKLIQQLNGQTQRLLGQQSLAAYTGLQVDIDRIRAENEAKTDVERKSGLIIWSGPNPTKAMKDAWRKEAQEKYGLNKEQRAEVEAQLAEVHTLAADRTAAGAALLGGVGGTLALDIMDTPVQDLSAQHTLTLLEMLHCKLQQTLETLQQHNLTLSIPEGFAGFLAQRQLAGEAPPPEASVLAEVPVPTDNSPADTDAAEPAKPTTARKRKPPAATGRGKGARRPKKQAYVDSEEDEDMEAADEDEEGMEYQQGGQRRGGKAVAKALAASGLVDELAHASNPTQGMGFARGKAQDALEMCEGDMQAAIEWLVANCV